MCCTTCKNDTKELMETDNSKVFHSTTTIMDGMEMIEVPRDPVAIKKFEKLYKLERRPHKSVYQGMNLER
ncbi:MAG: hypothetical protein CL530_00160 [Aequorivita sp.]|nr:hypothetical protein [Aequorivita sp.]